MLFIGTFFICLFIFMMQFLWRYVDELVGKGLEMSVMAQFFFYSALTLVPVSLPLAVLLASLITFGNFGERYELLAMKAAGISLLKIMRPLAFFVCGLVGVSFYFQNVVGPIAQAKLGTLILSMKQKSPELDIPEGVFYSEIKDYNLKVAKKNRKTGMLYDVLIYSMKDGFEKARIIYADSGRLEMTADKQHLWLHLYSGDLFENLKAQSMKSENVPYRREEFREKHTIIEFNSDFNMVDGEIMGKQSSAKDMAQLQSSIDSMTVVGDSIGRQYYREVAEGNFRPSYGLTKEDTIKIELLTPLTGTFLPNEMEQDWEEEDYNDFEEEQVFFEGDDLTEYASVIQEKIAEYNRVGHDDDRTDNLMDYFDGSAAIKEKVVSAVPSVKESDGVLYGCTTLELKEYLEAEELSELCEYLTGQYSDGWGEGFEQQEIPVEGGELCIHFWRPIDFEFQQAKSEVSKEKSEKQENPVNVPKRLKMQLLGMDGNVFAVMARASKLLQENGQGQEAKEMIARVQKSENYYQALHIISEYVETELSASSQNDTKPPKKRGKEECR